MTFLRRDTVLRPTPAAGAAPEPSFVEVAARAILAPEVEVVCFDVFDTLIKRRAPTPVAFFEAIGARLSRGGWLRAHVSPAQFRAQRAAAERRARERLAASPAGHHEVRLPAIWRELGHLLAPGRAPEDAAEAEFAVERAEAFGNALTLDLLALAQREGRRVLLVSDTYFSGAQVTQLLRDALRGRGDIDAGAVEVFASSDHGTGKGGGLFDLVLRSLGAPAPARLLHLGDNPAADVEAPARRGIRGLLLPNGTAEGREILEGEARYRPLGAAAPRPGPEAALPEGEVTSLRNLALLRSGAHGRFDHFAYGAFVLGPVLAHYLDWVEAVLDAEAEAGPIPVVCGLLREGGFLAELLAERRPRGLRVHALGTSRLALARAALVRATPETLAAALPARHAIPLDAFARRIGLERADFPRSHWTRSLSAQDTGLAEEVIGHVLADPALRGRVEAEAAAFRERMRRHLAAVLGGEGPAVLLDLGWAGTIQDRLAREFGLPAERLTGLYLALNDRGLERALSGMRAAGFLFDGPGSHRLAAAGLRLVEILEQAATPPQGSVVDYDERGAPVFAPDRVPERQRAERAEMQRGIRAYLDVAARHQAGPRRPDAEAARAVAQAVFLRAALAPTGAERRLFAGWMHDDSFADGALDALVPEPHRRLAPYMTPAQLAGAGFLHTYWPFGAADADSRWLAEQAAVAQRLGDRFDLVSRALPLAVEVRLGGGDPGWTLGGADPVALNGFNRFALEVESNTLMSDRLYLRFARRDRPDGAGPPPRVALEVACFAEAAGTGDGRRSLVLQGAALRDLLSAAAPGGGGHGLEADGSLALPPPIGGAGDDPPALVLRVPEAVMGWQGRVRIAFGLHLQDRPVAAGAPAPAAEEDGTGGSPPPRAQGWFDGLLGATSPLAPGVPVPLDPTAAEAAVVVSHGWIVDTAAWRGPDAVALVLEGPEGATRRFPAELVPRADIPRGFGRPIRGLTGVLCRVPLSALVLGRWRAAWEARFGGHPPVRVEAPGPVLLDVDDRQRPYLTLLPPPAAAAAAPLPVAAE